MGTTRARLRSLIAQQKTRPFDPDIAYSLAEVHFAAGQYRSGLDACRELLEHHYDTADTYLLKAQHELGLKWYADAKSSLELLSAVVVTIIKRRRCRDRYRASWSGKQFVDQRTRQPSIYPERLTCVAVRIGIRTVSSALRCVLLATNHGDRLLAGEGT